MWNMLFYGCWMPVQTETYYNMGVRPRLLVNFSKLKTFVFHLWLSLPPPIPNFRITSYFSEIMSPSRTLTSFAMKMYQIYIMYPILYNWTDHLIFSCHHFQLKKENKIKSEKTERRSSILL